MTALQGTSSSPPPTGSSRSLVAEDPELDSRYRKYRQRQAGALVPLLPKAALRPLYARAREWARGRGVELGKDPLALLLLFLEDLLPLPPLAVWVEDRSAFLEAHLQEEFASAQAHRRSSPPVTVESRGLEMNGRPWRATLNVFRRDEAWRGFIAFRPVGTGEPVRTGDIFRDEDPEEIRERFLAFHSGTLQAFLRSVLP
jgi:hypothetical protein